METFIVLLALGLVGGYVLGIVGFFRANSAHTELRSLRRALAERTAMPVAAEVPTPAPIAPAPIAVEPARPVEPVAADTQRETPLQEPAVEVDAEAAAPSPVPAPPAPPPPQVKPALDLETLLTARWGVWLGSAALLLAGVFLIRYAVEQELLGPGARCFFAALLGAALLAAAEWLQRQDGPSIPGPFQADQAPGGLAAGGTAILFAAAYGAGPFYGLLPPTLSFIAMAAASFIGMGAALRYGQLTAAIGIAGAFVTPALVITNGASMPGLFAYLFVVSAAALAVVRYTAWTWLGWATTAAGGIWVCIAAVSNEQELWAAAIFVPAVAALNLFLLPAAALDHPIGRRLAWVPFAAIGAAGLFL